MRNSQKPHWQVTQNVQRNIAWKNLKCVSSSVINHTFPAWMANPSPQASEQQKE